MDTVLITGATGFVGAYTAAAFLQEGWRVVGLDIRPPSPSLWPKGAKFLRADVRDPDALNRVTSESVAEHIVHAAGVVGPDRAIQDPNLTLEVNVNGTAHVVDVARRNGVRRITYLSTATLYGQIDVTTDSNPLTEAQCPNPVGLYDASKFMGEIYALRLAHLYNLDLAALRPSYVYGPGSRTGDYLVPDALRGSVIERSSGRDHPCEFTYVKDLAAAIVLMHSEWSGGREIFNISSGDYRTRGELADTIGRELPDVTIQLGPGIDPRRHLRPMMSLDKIRSHVGYRPKYDLERGIPEWIQWERAQMRSS